MEYDILLKEKWNDWLNMYIHPFIKKRRKETYPGLTADFLKKYSENIIWDTFSEIDRTRLVDLIYEMYIRDININNFINISRDDIIDERLKIGDDDYINYCRVRYSKRFIKYIATKMNVEENECFLKDNLEKEYIGTILLENGINIENKDQHLFLPQPILELSHKHYYSLKSDNNLKYFRLSGNFIQLCMIRLCLLLDFKFKVILKHFIPNRFKASNKLTITPKSSFYYDVINDKIVIKNYGRNIIFYVSFDTFPLIFKFIGNIAVIFDVNLMNNEYKVLLDIFLEEVIE